MEIDAALRRLKEATRDINEAKDNQQVKLTLERTWLLQDRLVFANQVSPNISKLSLSVCADVARNSTLHRKQESDPWGISNYVERCTYVGHPQTEQVGNT